MNAHSDSLTVSTRGKGTYEITDEVTRIVRSSGVTTGIATVFLQHTSASLVIYENADPAPAPISTSSSSASCLKTKITTPKPPKAATTRHRTSKWSSTNAKRRNAPHHHAE
jgi:hypothetical protein